MQHVKQASRWIVAVVALGAAVGCVPVANDTWTTTTVEADWSRFGSVEAVQEVVHRVEGNPAVGALVGAAIGSEIVGGHDTATLIGAAAGAIVGASVTPRRSVTRSYRVRVRFEDGSAQVFVLRDRPPFWPGDAVVLTPRGLAHA